MEGSEEQLVDPEECIRMKGNRKLVESGIQRFMNSFKGVRGAASNGYSSAGGIPVCSIIPLEFWHHVTDFLVEQRGMTKQDAETRMRSRQRWILVVVGQYRHEGLCRLGQRDPQRWAGFKWRVKLVPWKPLPVLRAFARHSNELNGKGHVVEITFFDTISALKQIANDLLREQGEVNESSRSKQLLNRIMQCYSAGKDIATDSTRQIAAVGLKLSEDVIDCIGEIINEENSKLANARAKNKARSAKTFKDPRVFRKIFNSGTFRKTPTFFTIAGDEDRKNTLRRLRYNAVCTENFKGVLPAEVEDQTKKSMAARKEAEKFEKVYGSSDWPPQMVGLKKNLLATAKMDGLIENISGNDRILLQPIADLYKRVCGEDAEKRMKMFSELGFVRDEGENEENSKATSENPELEAEIPPRDVDLDVLSPATGDTNPELSPESEDFSAEAESSVREEVAPDTIDEVTAVAETQAATASPKATDRVPIAVPCSLSPLGVDCFEYTWETYELNEVMETQTFDRILCEPSPLLPDGVKPILLDEMQKKRFAEFCKRMLVPGGCMILITTVDQYHGWSDAFRTVQMRVMKDALFLIKDTSKVQANKSDDPQCAVELAVVAWASGNRSCFKTDLVTGYEHVEGCSHKRKFNVIDNIPPPANRLTFAPRKKLVRPGEKSPQMYTELLQTFCPAGGRVLDPFANACTTGISCLASNRPCVLLESDSECFKLAKARLQAIAAQHQASESRPKRRCMRR